MSNRAPGPILGVFLARFPGHPKTAVRAAARPRFVIQRPMWEPVSAGKWIAGGVGHLCCNLERQKWLGDTPLSEQDCLKGEPPCERGGLGEGQRVPMTPLWAVISPR
jgi:hypothetical protein